MKFNCDTNNTTGRVTRLELTSHTFADELLLSMLAQMLAENKGSVTLDPEEDIETALYWELQADDEID